MAQSQHPSLRLKKRHDKRIRSGHGWIYSNEIDTTLTPLTGLSAGDPVVIENANGKFLAHAYVNPHSLITARVTAWRASQPFTQDTLARRLDQALALRQRRYKSGCYRWVFGEGDALPGLTIDRYQSVAVVQITTAGMERFTDKIVELLLGTQGIRTVQLRNDTAVREQESLPLFSRWIGDPVDCLVVLENNLNFQVPETVSQKTGWFYDHRESRAGLRHWVKGQRVLDVYSYLGSFGIHALHYGASQALAVDASKVAMEAAIINASINKVSTDFETVCGDAVDIMRRLYQDNERFDIVVLDPPAFIKRRKDYDAGVRHYGLNNRLAMRLLKPNGLLVSASCSRLLEQDELLRQIQQAKPRQCIGVQVLAHLRQAADHPSVAAMPETLYLKGVIARLLS